MSYTGVITDSSMFLNSDIESDGILKQRTKNRIIKEAVLKSTVLNLDI